MPRPLALLGSFALLVLASGSPLGAQATSVAEATGLRTQPEGPSIGELRPGAGVEVVEVRNGWSLVVVEGSVWLRSMQVDRREGFDLVISEREGENLRDEPGGSVVGRLLYGALLEELGRIPGWGHVRRSAWVRSEHLAVAGGEPAVEEASEDGEGVVTDASVAEIQGDSTRFLGRTIQLDLEFISVERAEPLRTDIREGEPFLLTRTSGSGGRHFVYVALPSSRLGEVEGMAPLEPLRITGRIRSAAAAFTGNLVLDLVEIERRR